jgi:hypothetical protein
MHVVFVPVPGPFSALLKRVRVDVVVKDDRTVRRVGIVAFCPPSELTAELFTVKHSAHEGVVGYLKEGRRGGRQEGKKDSKEGRKEGEKEGYQGRKERRKDVEEGRKDIKEGRKEEEGRTEQRKEGR